MNNVRFGSDSIYDRVLKVYFGRLGCMCGCQGKYKITADKMELASKDRGYAYDDEDVSERTVKRITKQVLNHPDVKFEGSYAYVEEGDRQKVVYFVEE
jgi:hypothetical protein